MAISSFRRAATFGLFVSLPLAVTVINIITWEDPDPLPHTESKVRGWPGTYWRMTLTNRIEMGHDGGRDLAPDWREDFDRSALMENVLICGSLVLLAWFLAALLLGGLRSNSQ